MDDWHSRRVFTTHAPPWLFPSRSPMPLHADTDDAPILVSGGASPPRIAVFVTDPRYLVVKHYKFLSRLQRWQTPKMEEFKLTQYVEALVSTIDSDTLDQMSFVQFSGGELVTTLAWAYAEAENPNRIQLFFLEDFVLQPEVAVRGLARFLDVSMITTASEIVLRQAANAIRMVESSNTMQDTLKNLASIGSVNQHIRDFEFGLAGASPHVQAGWEDIVRRWRSSPNRRMAAIAECALQHAPWDPPWWWALHSARMCRPCIFFPRGTCREVECAYCHGPDHPKPKRPSRARRKARHQRYDRTPSPEPYLPPIADAGPMHLQGLAWIVPLPVHEMQ